jgi:hypothetical protein
MLAVFEPERHRGLVDLLSDAYSPTREIARGDAGVQRRGPDLVDILHGLAVKDRGAKAGPFAANPGLYVPLMAVWLGDAAEDGAAVVILVAIVAVQEQSCGEMLDIATDLEEAGVLVE